MAWAWGLLGSVPMDDWNCGAPSSAKAPSRLLVGAGASTLGVLGERFLSALRGVSFVGTGIAHLAGEGEGSSFTSWFSSAFAAAEMGFNPNPRYGVPACIMPPLACCLLGSLFLPVTSSQRSPQGDVPPNSHLCTGDIPCPFLPVLVDQTTGPRMPRCHGALGMQSGEAGLMCGGWRWQGWGSFSALISAQSSCSESGISAPVALFPRKCKVDANAVTAADIQQPTGSQGRYTKTSRTFSNCGYY